jgi:hypothetical protein
MVRSNYAGTPKGSAQHHWKLIAVHATAEKSLRIESIGHIDAVAGIGFDGSVHNVFSLRVNSHKVQQVRERNADPLGYVRASWRSSNDAH